jgi:chemotaxis protein methyltransferase CheR
LFLISEDIPEAPFVGSEFPDADYERLCALLLQRRGFDLGRYKDRCVKRRIAARVRTCGFQAAGPYLDLLERDERELDALMAALTIHVSQFFRNPETYRVLDREVLPRLVDRARSAGRRKLRLWSVGCAGGEEPYSLALLVEALDPGRLGLDVEILATDVSPAVLDRAREGLFDETRLLEVPREVRDRYFVPVDRRYRVTKNVRRRVRFLQHDILADRDYPRAGLILCRNVLIYFSRAEQERILERFADVLGPGGYLVLGRAETLLGEARDWFTADYPVERIYRCRRQAGA